MDNFIRQDIFKAVNGFDFQVDLLEAAPQGAGSKNLSDFPQEKKKSGKGKTAE
jgi:hypothetical protein